MNNILVRRNELGRHLKTPVSTIKYYTTLGLFKIADTTEGGMRLYDLDHSKTRFETITKLKAKGLSLKKIQNKFKGRK